MHIYNPALRGRLLGHVFLNIGQKRFDHLIDGSENLLQETFAVAERIHFPDTHAQKSFDVSEFMVPSTQEEFKNTYIQFIVRAAERFAPNLPLRVNEKTISIRLTGPSLERMHHALYNTYENEPYWNQHFNENYPRLVEMFNSYKQEKAFTEEYSSSRNALYRYVKTGDRTFIHLDISDEIINRLHALIFDSSYQQMRQSLESHLEDQIFIPLKRLFNMFYMVLLVNEMYDGLKAKTDAHKQAYIQQTLDARKAQFDVYEKWFIDNRVVSDQVAMEMLGFQSLQVAEALNALPVFEGGYVLPLDIKPELPVGLELRLYQDKEDTKKWLGTIMTPELEQPQLEGYNNPAVGTITSIKDDGSVVVNDFLDVQINYVDIRDTLVKYSSIESIPLLAEVDATTREHVDTLTNRLRVSGEVTSSPIGVGSVPEQPEQTTETITLEELMARHGIRPNAPQQDVPVVDIPEPEQEAPAQQETINIDVFPSGYRLTNHGDGNFSLAFQENGNQVFHLGISTEEVKTHLLRLGFVQSFPAMVHCDRNAEHARSLAHPFSDLQNYLLI